MLARPMAEFPKHWFPIICVRERRKSAYIYKIPDWKCRVLDSLLAWFDTILWRTLHWDDPNSHCNVQSYGSIDENIRLNVLQVKKWIRTFQLRPTEGSSDWGNWRSTGVTKSTIVFQGYEKTKQTMGHRNFFLPEIYCQSKSSDTTHSQLWERQQVTCRLPKINYMS